MGQRYRDGDGVGRDPLLARDWLAKAAYQGHPQAIKELSELHQTVKTTSCVRQACR
jgi:TPR repeat protein